MCPISSCCGSLGARASPDGPLLCGSTVRKHSGRRQCTERRRYDRGTLRRSGRSGSSETSLWQESHPQAAGKGSLSAAERGCSRLQFHGRLCQLLPGPLDAVYASAKASTVAVGAARRAPADRSRRSYTSAISSRTMASCAAPAAVCATITSVPLLWKLSSPRQPRRWGNRCVCVSGSACEGDAHSGPLPDGPAVRTPRALHDMLELGAPNSLAGSVC